MKRRLWNQIIIAGIIFIFLALFTGCKSGDQQVDNTVAPEELAEYDAIKLTTSSDGMYRLPLSDIGWNNVNTDSIALIHKDKSVSYWIEDSKSGQNFIFYAKSSSSQYTPHNVYIIKQDPDLTQVMTTQALPEVHNSAVDNVISTIHFEENLIYTPRAGTTNPWHWAKIIAPQSQTYEINLPGLVSGPGNLRLALWGVTIAPVSPAHHMQISINAHTIGEAAWDGQSPYILNIPIPIGVLQNGKNEITIHATGEVEARIDIFNLDWFEIEYRKNSDTIDTQEIFSVGNQAIRLPSFEASPTIFDISDTHKVRFIELTERGESITFQGKPWHRYIVANQDSYKYPDHVQPFNSNPDLRNNPGANYLAIGHPDLLESIEPLLKFRSDQGLITLNVPVSAIYDQFNGGIAEPQAINNFLKYAVENWEISPEYILLVGDTNYDYYGYQNQIEEYFLPTIMVNTVYGGATASDVLIGQIDEDQWPDLAIGRVPARTKQQVDTFVSKTLEYEDMDSSVPWNNTILAVADGEESRFRIDAEHFIKKFPDTFQTYLVSPDPGLDDANQQIVDQIESGKFLAAYFGHGSINMWGKDNIFNTKDSDNLRNLDRLPIILNFTCLTGLFTHPIEQSLAESLLFNDKGGAVAVLAPTSPTLPNDQTFLSDAIIEALLQEPVPRLGDITLAAWRQVPTSSESVVDVMQTFLLFGDPALQLPTQ